MRILSRRTTQPTSKYWLLDTDTNTTDSWPPTTAKCLKPGDPIGHHPGSLWCDYSQCPRVTPAQAPFRVLQCTMLPLQPTEPPASAEDCRWLEPHPCKLEPRRPSASPMQVATLAPLPHRTPGHAFATEEALLQGATLPCSPSRRITFWTRQ